MNDTEEEALHMHIHSLSFNTIHVKCVTILSTRALPADISSVQWPFLTQKRTESFLHAEAASPDGAVGWACVLAGCTVAPRPPPLLPPLLPLLRLRHPRPHPLPHPLPPPLRTPYGASPPPAGGCTGPRWSAGCAGSIAAWGPPAVDLLCPSRHAAASQPQVASASPCPHITSDPAESPLTAQGCLPPLCPLLASPSPQLPYTAQTKYEIHQEAVNHRSVRPDIVIHRRISEWCILVVIVILDGIQSGFRTEHRRCSN
eukprot:scaffold560388_cov37-Prasinocladus_malaysianus.AAC.1